MLGNTLHHFCLDQFEINGHVEVQGNGLKENGNILFYRIIHENFSSNCNTRC